MIKTLSTTQLAANADVISGGNVNDIDVVNGISTISETLSKYGPTIVICSVFILLFVVMFLVFMKICNRMLNSIMEQMDKKSDESSDLYKKLVDHFMEDIGDHRGNPDTESQKQPEDVEDDHSTRNKDLVGLFIDYNTTFKKEERNVINTLRCDRVAVYVFHNGNKTLYGLPFIKMSCVSEETLKGILTMRGTSHVNLPLHLFNDLIESLYKYGEYAGNIDDVEIHDDSIRQFLAYSDSKSLFMKAIKKEDGSLAGFTVCEFTEGKDFTNEETYNEIKFALRDMNTAIRYIVTNEQFTKKLEENPNA